MALVQSTTVTGLQTFIFSCPTADNYTIQGTLQLPNIVPTATPGPGAGAGSGTGGGIQISSQVVTVVKHNSSTIYTSNPGDRGFLIGVEGASAGDTISVIFSSSLKQDQKPNVMSCTITVSEGAAL